MPEGEIEVKTEQLSPTIEKERQEGKLNYGKCFPVLKKITQLKMIFKKVQKGCRIQVKGSIACHMETLFMKDIIQLQSTTKRLKESTIKAHMQV